MAAKHQKSFTWQHEGRTRKVTYVQAETTQIDEKGLRRALTAKVFDKFTVKKLDRKAMEAAMDSGEVDPMVVARFVSAKPNSPFIRYTEKDSEEGDLL